MWKIVFCVLVALLAMACTDVSVNEGYIISKEYLPETSHISSMTVGDTVILYIDTDPEQYWFVLNDDGTIGDCLVSQAVWKSMNVGDYCNCLEVNQN